MEKVKKKYRGSILSTQPFRRRPESEMIKILTEIRSSQISKRGACKKYGINRNTMALFIRKFSLRTLGQDISNQLLENMPEEKKNTLLEKKIRDLAKQLEQANLKNAALQEMIRVAEEELHIRIKKKRGTKQSKE